MRARWPSRADAHTDRSRPPERGAGTVLVLAASAVVVVVLSASLLVAHAVREAHRARSAADLGALAAARGLLTGGPADCAAAAAVAAEVGALVSRCRVLGDGSVLVVAGVRARWPAGWPGLPPVVSAEARAGPEGVVP